MRRYIYIVALVLSSGFCAPVIGGNLTAYLNIASYNSVGGQCYFETYLNVIGRSAVFLKDSNNKLQGKVNIMVSFFKGDSIVMANNYNLLSPETMDTSKRGDFIDVQRYWLKKGKYTMQLTVADKNNPKGKTFTVKQKINVGYPLDSVFISDAEFLESFTPSTQKQSTLYKNGFNMVPYVYSYYPDEVRQMSFYAEVYNTVRACGAGDKVIVKYFIESYETHTRLFDFNSVNVKATDTIIPLLGQFNMDKLPSGSYYLVVQVIDKNNRVRATCSYPFLRHNKNMELSMKDLAAVNVTNTFVDKIVDKDTLIDYIKSLWPISGLNEREFIRDNDFSRTDAHLLKQYFYNFWVSRSNTDPEGEWKKYKTQVNYVNKQFKTYGMKGYETDRGRVYLQYGVPDQRVTSVMNPSSFPYEIWEYYRLKTGEVDRKFIFYEPTLVTNNYELLHSDATGEIHNRQWQLILNSTTGTPGNVDVNSVPDAYGENSLDEFSNPR